MSVKSKLIETIRTWRTRLNEWLSWRPVETDYIASLAQRKLKDAELAEIRQLAQEACQLIEQYLDEEAADHADDGPDDDEILQCPICGKQHTESEHEDDY